MKDFSNELIKIICDRVKDIGPITFKDFMEMALYRITCETNRRILEHIRP
jgi:hypothetical protein